ncbi:dihydrofolate reductase family protein [Streptomyces sp. NPDC088789]|uniref:dihydrofolate reductase family protein n=1 Tax=Streptomyces sp. NPDC088789 TaxID=3365899 RepID=UPI003807044C
MRKLTYYIACSLDGFIGDPTGDATAMMSYVDEEFLAYLAEEFPETLPTHVRRATGNDHLANKHYDTIIQGRGSYDLALQEGITSPYAHMRQYVASSTLKESPDPDVEIIGSDVLGWMRELKAEEGGLGIYLCGGARIAGELFPEVDELVIKTYPVVYGSGMPMFGGVTDLAAFTLGSVRGFGNGVLVRTYTRKR